MAPGEHVPAHAPSMHAKGHVAAFAHLPEGSHVSRLVPLHRIALGTQLPMHSPELHAYVHAVRSCHAPKALQVRGTRPVHEVAPAAHAKHAYPVALISESSSSPLWLVSKPTSTRTPPDSQFEPGLSARRR
jgi:hypothetical protein